MSTSTKFPQTHSQDNIGTAWSNIANLLAEDTQYASVSLSANTSSTTISLSNFDFSIPKQSSIESVKVRFYGAHKTGTGGVTLEVGLIDRAHIDNSLPQLTTTPTTLEVTGKFNTSDDTQKDWWTDTGDKLSAGDINTTGFGTFFKAVCDAAGSATVNIDAVDVTITYNTRDTFNSATGRYSQTRRAKSVISSSAGNAWTGGYSLREGVAFLQDASSISAEVDNTPTHTQILECSSFEFELPLNAKNIAVDITASGGSAQPSNNVVDSGVQIYWTNDNIPDTDLAAGWRANSRQIYSVTGGSSPSGLNNTLNFHIRFAYVADDPGNTLGFVDLDYISATASWDLGTSSGNFPLFISGYDTSTSGFPLYISGSQGTQATSGFPLYLSATESSSGNFDLYLVGHSSANSGFPLYLHNTITSGNFPLFLKMYDVGSGNFPLFVHGHSGINNNFPLFLSGFDYSSGNFPLTITGSITNSGTFPLYLKAGSFDTTQFGSGDFPLFVFGSTAGTSGQFTQFPLFLQSDNFPATLPLFLLGSSSAELSSGIPLYTVGHVPSLTTSFPLYIANSGQQGTFPLYIAGLAVSLFNNPFTPNAGVPATGVMPLFLMRNTAEMFTLFLMNALVSSGNFPLYVFGALAANSGIPLAMPQTHDVKSASMNLFTIGF